MDSVAPIHLLRFAYLATFWKVAHSVSQIKYRENLPN